MAADTADFDRKMKSAAQQTRAWQKTATDLFNATRTPAEQHRTAMIRVSDAYALGKINLETYSRSIQKLSQEWYVASGGAARLRAQIEAINASAMTGGGGLGAAATGMGRFGSSLLPIASRIGTVTAGLAVFGTLAGARESLRLAEDFETTSVSMEVLMRDVQGSKRLINDLYQYAAHTPFEFPDVAQAGKQLLGYGEDAKQIMPDIRMLGNVASALDIPLTELANVFGRNRNQLHLYTRDINELANRGVPVIQYLAKHFGVANTEVKQLVEDGKVGFEDLRSAMEAMSATGGQFEGMTERLGTTMKGVRTTAVDEMKSSLRELGNTLGAVVLPQFAEFTTSLNEIVQLKAHGFEATETGQMFAASQARQAESGPMDNLQSTGDQLRRVNEEIAAQSKKQAEISKRLSGMVFGNPILGATTQLQEVELLNRSINGLLRERQILGQRAAQQREEEGDLAKVVSGSIGNAVNEAGRLLNLGEQNLKTWTELADRGVKNFNEQFRGVLDTAKQVAKEGQRIKQIIESARSPSEVFDRSKGELDRFLESGKITQKTYDEALRQATDRRDRDIESRSPEFREAKRMADDAKRLKDELMTPLERYQQDLARITELGKVTDEKGGFVLSEDDLARARKQAEERFFGGGGTQSSENKALSRGSSEAFSAINRANDKKKLDDIQQQALDLQRQQWAVQNQQLAAAQNVAVWT